MSTRQIVLCLAAFASLAAPSIAWSGPVDPVQRLMDTAKELWSDNPPENADYFSEERLKTDFSQAFVAAFREASKNPPYGLEEGQTTGYPFDYDPITSGQDGCPLEDVTIKETGASGGTTNFEVSFKPFKCFGEGDDANMVRILKVTVKEEGGRSVIDDIVRVIDGEELPLVAEMKQIATAPAGGDE